MLDSRSGGESGRGPYWEGDWCKSPDSWGSCKDGPVSHIALCPSCGGYTQSEMPHRCDSPVETLEKCVQLRIIFTSRPLFKSAKVVKSMCLKQASCVRGANRVLSGRIQTRPPIDGTLMHSSAICIHVL